MLAHRVVIDRRAGSEVLVNLPGCRGRTIVRPLHPDSVRSDASTPRGWFVWRHDDLEARKLMRGESMMVKRSRTGRFAPALIAMALGLVTLTTGHWRRDVLAQAKRETVRSLRMYIFDLGEIPVNEGRMFNPPIQ